MEAKNILVVEDDRALSLLVSEILTDAGFRPITIADHATIEASVDRWQPRCVILDGEDRSAGESRTWADAASIRRTHPTVPVVIFTADQTSLAEARAASSPRSVAAGFAGIIAKPFVVDEFLATVKSAVEGTAAPEVTSVFPDIGRLSPDWPETDLFGTIIHELRGPLTAIRGNVQLALRRMSSDLAREREPLDFALGQVDRMSALVAELLDEGRLASNGLSLNVVWFDLVAAVAESVAVHDYSLPSRISFVRPPDSVRVQADPVRIAQIMDNLIGNALKYSAPDSPVVVSVTASGAEVQVRVTDRGVGVPDGERALLFTPFFRTTVTRRMPGTGLGLHISRKLAERHRGRVWLEESSTAGSTFALALPTPALP